MKKRKIILIIISIIIFSIGITSKSLQNDTFYNIAIGKLILSNGIDFKDHFSMFDNLSYPYPHWAFDVTSYLFYNIGGWYGIYIMVMIFNALLGIAIFFSLHKLKINSKISIIATFATMFLLKNFMVARAQAVSMILFILEIFCIEKFLETTNKKYGIYLFIIAVLIANFHVATWWFFFVLFLPYIAEYIVTFFTLKESSNRNYNKYKKKYNKLLAKNQNTKKFEKVKKELEYYKKYSEYKNNEPEKEPYKILIKRNNNTKYLIILLLICLFSGLCTPLKDAPYTYLIKTYMGITTNYISEHQPLTIITSLEAVVTFVIIFGFIFFTDTKLRLSDAFMLLGTILLTLISKRQLAILIIVSSFILSKSVHSFTIKYNADIKEDISYKSLIILLIVISIISSYIFYKNSKYDFIDESFYPTEAVKYIKENLNTDDIRLFNEYNYGSYLLFNDIKVFIDSRADLYDSVFNKDCTIFKDAIVNINDDYENIFDKYDITHVLLSKDNTLYKILVHDSNYTNIYEDSYFVIFER